jgi:Uma2 family endonuclease
MGQRAHHVPYSEYLALEASGDGKHDYVAGMVYAMAGGTPEHARLQAALSLALGAALRGKPCAVYSSDLRVRIEATDRSTYPDVTVVCGALKTSAVDNDGVIHPTLLVEVTSESTEANDRGRWELADEAGPEGAVHLASIDVRVDAAEIYRDPLAALA